RSIKGAQHRVEGLHFEIRKQLLEYDDIANEQRKIIYDQRDYHMASENVHDTVIAIIESILKNLIYKHMPPDALEEQWDLPILQKELANFYHIEIDLQSLLDKQPNITAEELANKIVKMAIDSYQSKQANFDNQVIYQIEKSVLLQVLDNQWKDHLVAMDYLRQSVGLRGYAQKDPRQEYKRESFFLFESLLEAYRQEVCSVLLHYNMFSAEQLEQLESHKRAQLDRERESMQLQHSNPDSVYTNNSDDNQTEGDTEYSNESKLQPVRREHPKIGRNDKCFCGSGHKYKNCHGLVSSTSFT
ncbi:MAG: SEC-C domain-containing protein, partial [Gammaproteobacteria bacterium]|nr:SEC-C domain-containing protein [Gammaproteobacteria bacterium]